MTCPDCERYKISASMWRNKAYEASGHPLPWNVEELLEKSIRSEREACAMECIKLAHGWARLGAWGENNEFHDCATAIRARGIKQRGA